MRAFFNLFLTGFALDAAVSVVDDLSRLLLGADIIGTPRDILALAVFCLSPLAYLACGFDSRLPKPVLLPLAVFALWCGFGALPLAFFLESGSLLPVLSLAQLGLAACAFLYLRKKTGDWLPPRDYFAGPAWSPRNAATFTLANIALVPAALALLLATSVYGYLRQNTGDFIRLGRDGIHLEERSYVRDGRTVRLIPMIHIGSADHYRELGALLNNSDAIVLAEGISDREELLESSLSYSRMADFIGLDVQENMELQGRIIEYEELGTPQAARESGIVHADIDSGELSEETHDFIENVGQLFGPGDSFLENFRRYTEWYQANMTPEREQAVFAEIIDKRNASVLRHLDRALPGHDLILIPWGAMHMPGIEAGLLERGFARTGSVSRLAIAFKDLFSGGDERAPDVE